MKPAEGEGYYNQGGRGGRGRSRGGTRGGFGGFRGNSTSNVPAPSIEDPGHFPTLGGKWNSFSHINFIFNFGSELKAGKNYANSFPVNFYLMA